MRVPGWVWAGLLGSDQRSGRGAGRKAWTKSLRRDARARAGSLRDRALGKGQVLEEHVQAAVLLVEELLHPPAGHSAP